jgi:alpha-ribazole phosphatase
MKGAAGCRIYLIRHGETANAGKVCFNGHFDVGLSPEGTAQFEALGQAFKGLRLEAIYTSDLARTRLSAALIAAPHGLIPIAFAEFKELSFGAWEGLSIAEVERLYPGQLEERMRDIENFSVTGGETFEQLRARVVPTFNDIVARHPQGNLVIVAHGGVNRVILAHLLHIPVKHYFRIQQDYGGVNIIQYYETGPVVEVIGGGPFSIRATAPAAKKIPLQ